MEKLDKIECIRQVENAVFPLYNLDTRKLWLALLMQDEPALAEMRQSVKDQDERCAQYRVAIAGVDTDEKAHEMLKGITMDMSKPVPKDYGEFKAAL